MWRTGFSLKAGRKESAPALQPIRWKNKALGALANMAVVKFQLGRLSEGRRTHPQVSPLHALVRQQLATQCQTRRYRKWMARRVAR